MSNLKNRLNKIEKRAGLGKEKSYIFIHIMHPEGFVFEKRKNRGDGIYCSKDDFKGMVVICGGNSGNINSEEKKKILLENGYEILET